VKEISDIIDMLDMFNNYISTYREMLVDENRQEDIFKFNGGFELPIDSLECPEDIEVYNLVNSLNFDVEFSFGDEKYIKITRQGNEVYTAKFQGSRLITFFDLDSLN